MATCLMSLLRGAIEWRGTRYSLDDSGVPNTESTPPSLIRNFGSRQYAAAATSYRIHAAGAISLAHPWTHTRTVRYRLRAKTLITPAVSV
jgi:hypothetical protein